MTSAARATDALGDYLQRILTARVYDVAVQTPLERAPRLSARLGHDVWLKREDLQPVFSFKLRGAYNKIARLSAEERARGVIAASAGNHAQGVAVAASAFGVPAIIVMPTSTPEIKIRAVAAQGGRVVLHGATFDEACAYAVELAATRQLTFVHPYDDPDVIAGQGTVGMEILRQHPTRPDAIFVGIGGGGLAAGVAAYVKALYPDVAVIGVEPAEAASMRAALAAGAPVTLDDVGRFADGASVRRAGTETFRVCQALLDDVVVVSNDEICMAIKHVFEDTRSILEPAGALAVAGLEAWAARRGGEGRALVAVASGANVDFDRLRYVAQRAQVGTFREAQLAVTVPETPGSFLALQDALGGRPVSELVYRRRRDDAAHVFVGVVVTDREDARALVDGVEAAGLRCLDLSDDELAKEHLRHLAGGMAPDGAPERLLRFTFPERPGALRRFLDHFSPRFDVSLFHYRHAGGDEANVMVGFRAADDRALDEALATSPFAWREVTQSPACRLLLGG